MLLEAADAKENKWLEETSSIAFTGCAGSFIDQINARINIPPKRVKEVICLCKLVKGSKNQMRPL